MVKLKVDCPPPQTTSGVYQVYVSGCILGVGKATFYSNTELHVSNCIDNIQLLPGLPAVSLGANVRMILGNCVPCTQL